MMTVRRISSFLLAMLMLVSASVPVKADEAYEENYVVETYNYLFYERYKNLTDDGYYCYEQFVENVDDPGSCMQTAMDLAGLTLDLEYDPGTDDYIGALSNVLSLMEDPTLSSLNDQSALDDLKGADDYLEDVVDLGMNIAGQYLGTKNNGTLTTASEVISSLKDTGVDSAESAAAVQHLTSLIQQYAAYDELLKNIEENSTGGLRHAAASMRGGSDAVFSYTLNNYIELTANGGVNYSMTFLDCFTDNSIRALEADGFDAGLLSMLSKVKDRFELTQDLTMLAGNLVLNSEDAAYRTREMAALSDIADAASRSLDGMYKDYCKRYDSGKASFADAEECVEMAQFLLMTRRRGEYCLYNLIRENSGVLSAAFGGDAEVDEWYRKLTEYLNNESWKLAKIWAGQEVLTVNRYQVFNGEAMTWEEAAAYCESLGGHLVTIGSYAENGYVYAIMKEAGYTSAYIGLKETSEGVWEWVNGEPVIYLNWGGREPNNEGGDENYGMFYYKFGNGQWNDGDFGGNTSGGGIAFICEWPEGFE